MMRVIRSGERYHAKEGGIDRYWHFSFDYYYDPENIAFGPLRAFNDETIQPQICSGMHPHQEMEVVTYVVQGELEHEDSKGHKGRLHAGGLQRISAGTGIYHSETNPSATEPLRLCQIWVLPAEKGLAPSYEQAHFGREERHNRLLPVVSGQEKEQTLRTHQDATFYISSLDEGAAVQHRLAEGRRGYLFVIEGELTVNGETLYKGDQARIRSISDLRIKANRSAELILIDLP